MNWQYCVYSGLTRTLFLKQSYIGNVGICKNDPRSNLDSTNVTWMSTDSNKNMFLGCAIIKKCECSLLITENWVQSQHNSCVICDGQKSGRTSLALSTSVFLLIIIPPMFHIYLCIIHIQIGPIVAGVPRVSHSIPPIKTYWYHTF
jgi:hypothetical protein